MNKSRMAFYLLGLLCLSLTAKASIQPGWVGNFLIGVSAGYADLYGDLSTSLNYQGREPDNDIFQTSYSTYDNSGFMLGVLAGYQEIRHLWLVGAEINFELHALDEVHQLDFSDSHRQIDWMGTVRYSRKNTIGISGRLGFAMTQYFMPYLRLGGEFSRDTLSAAFSGDMAVFPQELVISKRHWLHRFLLGIGAEFPLLETCGATIRVEYNFHSKARTIKGEATYLDEIYSPTLQTGFQPQMQSAKISFIWNFF